VKREYYFRDGVIDLMRGWFAVEDDVLLAARARAREAGVPLIEVAPEDGALLALLVAVAQPALVVEIGTLFGYSAVWMARRLPPGGHLLTLEVDPARAALARRTLAEAGVADRAEVVEGKADESLRGIAGPVDLVFIDAEKTAYPAYLAWARRALRAGGLLAADNTFRRFLAPGPDDEDRRGLRRFLETLATDPAWQATVVPTLEGMALARRTEAP
jgi:predicted O-methyltransferase YrrM